ncbi:MAG: hypothetical protein KKC05_02480, partial [Nanoarchaeota archaeon]|nr:hypothetical protein [Nanoarchaeota archaeon]
TLIEVLIIIVILAILVALAIPRFMQATVKSKQSKSMQSEAKNILKLIYVMERTHRELNSVYLACDYNAALSDIGVDIPKNAIYAYSVELVGTVGFKATAKANIDDDPVMDIWEIDNTGMLKNTVNDVTANY